jgi:thiol-disulfide isomerase/thioredoxin
MKKISLAVFLAVSVVAVYLLAGSRLSGPGAPPAPASKEAPNSPDPSEKAPALSGPGLDGKTVALSAYAGKIVLVDFWATWCDPCKEEIPDLVKLRDKLKDKGFEILSVSMDEAGAAAVKKFTARRPICPSSKAT